MVPLPLPIPPPLTLPLPLPLPIPIPPLNDGKNNHDLENSQIKEEDKSSTIESLLSALLNDDNLSEEQIDDLKDTLNSLKDKSQKISKKIKALEQILDAEGKLEEEKERKDATTLLSVANCVNIKIDIEF